LIDWKVLSLCLFLILLMFSLDVLRDDTANIQHAWDSITDRAIDKLANSKPTDNSWYEFSYESVHHRFRTVYDRTSDRVRRKLRVSCELKLERIVFFGVPWVIVYLYARPTFRPKRRASNGPSTG
jgi:hypothetical protein